MSKNVTSAQLLPPFFPRPFPPTGFLRPFLGEWRLYGNGTIFFTWGSLPLLPSLSRLSSLSSAR